MTTKSRSSTGYTLVELLVAVGLFALIMTLASGAYFVMIGVNRQAQAITTGINNLAFALETMTRTIRTSTDYACDNSGNCPIFSMKNANGIRIAYTLLGGAITQSKNGGTDLPLTDPSAIGGVTVTALKFYLDDEAKPTSNYKQARVTIIVSGTVSSGPGKTEVFTIETGATMRGTDL